MDRGTLSASSLQRQSPGNLYKYLPKLRRHLAKHESCAELVVTVGSLICQSWFQQRKLPDTMSSQSIQVGKRSLTGRDECHVQPTIYISELEFYLKNIVSPSMLRVDSLPWHEEPLRVDHLHSSQRFQIVGLPKDYTVKIFQAEVTQQHNSRSRNRSRLGKSDSTRCNQMIDKCVLLLWLFYSWQSSLLGLEPFPNLH